jgi:hypothetical protein
MAQYLAAWTVYVDWPAPGRVAGMAGDGRFRRGMVS